jgi:hypothetical protein
MRGEQRHGGGGGGIVHACSKDRWLSSPWLNGKHWSLMGACEPLPVMRIRVLVSVQYGAN